MYFEPKTEKAIADARLFKAGVYDFEVIDAEDTTSKTSGKPMIVLTLSVSNAAGERKPLKDYLLSQTAGKLRHAAAACGLLGRYDTGSISAEEFVGKTGKLKLKIEKDRKRQYPDKNAVVDYIFESTGKVTRLLGDGAESIHIDTKSELERIMAEHRGKRLAH